MKMPFRLAPFLPCLGLFGLATLFGMAALFGCSDPFRFDANPQQQSLGSALTGGAGGPAVTVEEEEICPASEEWLPRTPPLGLFQPVPHPATECPFYRGGWQNFLI